MIGQATSWLTSIISAPEILLGQNKLSSLVFFPFELLYPLLFLGRAINAKKPIVMTTAICTTNEIRL